MALYLDEDMVGVDANMIAFPHLVLCMGVVLVMGDGSLVGAHFTQPSTERTLLRLMIVQARQNGSGMSQLYCLADMDQHVRTHGGLDIMGKAEGLGFTGSGYAADFGVLKPTDGTYAQVTSNGAAQRATVRCKLNQEVTYAHGGGAAALIVKSHQTHLANGQAFSRIRVAVAPPALMTTGAVADYLSTPFLAPVDIA
jgi:hypothetical protein